ncbi:MAG: MotA/TolQ/ExbB proton channel family protein [Thiomicrospira sp.]|uniref:motility protein A n=1 Tax=Thiomicrospira sp. TaxID=935 RepID=UPI0019E13333|nr:MotA/TolQ/ExbB proton channel family protein [Thiomicrospira sp.]MBE0493681.1 MotA/TolQ/ExbB proton channel family protein [Thiomicrospira sp.]
MSRSATILGLLFGLIIVLLSMVDKDSGQIIGSFFNWQGLLVVLGGTFAAVLVNYPLNMLGCVFRGFAKIVVSEPSRVDRIIHEVERLSHISHKQGLLSLEREIDNVEDEFLRFSLTEMMVYQDQSQLLASVNNRQYNTQLRHMQCQELFNNMASYSPAFGMMGTVMGLIIMMTSHVGGVGGDVYEGGSEDMLAGLLAGMGLALVTTFYGVLFANLIYIPVAGKLKVLSEAETLKNEVIIRGVVGLKLGQSPMLVMESMLSFVNEKTKERLENHR